jgi:hypothetical protein
MKEPIAESLETNRLPIEFIYLLKSNMNGKMGNYNGFLQYLNSFPFLAAVLSKSFRDIDSLGRPEIIFKSLGWEGIRRRLFEIYFLKRDDNQSAQYRMELLEKLETRYSSFSVDGISRHLLFFFYLNTLEERDHIVDSANIFLTEVASLDYLKFFKKRVLKLDLLLLGLFLFESYLGRTKLLKELEIGEYDALYLKLNREQKKDYCEVFLHYSFSIDDDLFFEDRV